MPPANKGQGTTAKRGRPTKNSETVDKPPAKKRATGKTGVQQPKKASSASSVTSSQLLQPHVIEIEDDDADQAIKPVTARSSMPKPTSKLTVKPQEELCIIQEILIKPMVKPIGEFPRFKDGDVIIELRRQNTKFTYQLHGSVLGRSSSWFEEMLRLDMRKFEPDPLLIQNHPMTGRMSARFETKYCPELKIHILARSVFGYVKDIELDIPVLEQSATTTIGDENDRNIETHLTSSSPELQHEETSNTMDKVQIARIPASGGEDGRRINRRGSVNDENLTFATVSSAPISPQSFRHDSTTDCEEQKADDDVIMIGTKAVLRPAAKMARDDTGKTGICRPPVDNLESSTPAITPTVEGRLLIEENLLVSDVFTGQMSGTSVDRSSEKSLETNRPMQQIASSIPASGSSVEYSCVRQEEPICQDTVQFTEAETTIKQEDPLPTATSEAPKDTPAIKQEDSADDIIMSAGPNVQVVDSANGVIAKSNNEAAESQFLTKEEEFAEVVSAPNTESCEIKEVETQSRIFAPLVETFAVDQDYISAGLNCPVLIEKFGIKQEESEIPNLAADPELELPGRKDNAVQTAPLALQEQEHNGETGLRFEADIPSSLKQHCPENLDGREITIQKEDIDLSICAEFIGAKKEHGSAIPKEAQHDSQKSDKKLSCSSLLEIPQGDSSAELDISERHMQAQSSSLRPTLHSKDINTTSVIETDKPDLVVSNAYNNLFLTFYSCTPLIDTQDIRIALEQSELLIKVARVYGAVPVVRPHINSALMHFGRELYVVMKEDPPRWIYLALFLESAPLFQEGIIHIVANHPYWPWPTSGFDDLPYSVIELIEQKTYTFATLKESVNKSLFLNQVRDVEVFSRPLNEDGFDTWFVVQYWRDWFTRSLAQANKASEDGQKCTRGKVYRDLYRSGEAYLPTILLLDAVAACRSKDVASKSKRQGVEQDLKTLKDFAQKEVKSLCANYSMLSVEDAGIDYLTCIRVENHELPWVKSKLNRPRQMLQV